MSDQTVDLYRLTSENILVDAHGNAGTVGYSYDNVGNRQQRTSSVTAVPMQNFSGQYDLNDRLTASGYVYDSNGSTTTDPNGTYLYDALGRMTSATVGGVTTTYIYDADGNKVSQNVNGTITNYLIDSNNLTGYAQVLEEQQGGSVNRVYSYGTSRISEDQLIGGNWTLNYYGYDGQGSVRYLTDSTGTITDTYDYDAFGILINHTGTTPNAFLYDGEENNPNGLYYLRARYMNEGIGRFQSMDTFEGNRNNPLSLHKYVFGANEPINLTDPSGNDFDIGSLSLSFSIISVISSFPTVTAGDFFDNPTLPDSAFPPLDPRISKLITRDGTSLSNPREIVKQNILYTLTVHNSDQYIDWKSKFVQGGPWDYKIHQNKYDDPVEFQRLADFGNFNFGVQGSAIRIYGFPLSSNELRVIGGYDEEQKYKDDPTLGPYPYDPHNPYSHGDRPDDSIWIDNGVHYWNEIEAAYHGTIDKIRMNALEGR